MRVGELRAASQTTRLTVFDSTGIALQDSATVPLEYERAVLAGVGVEKKMFHLAEEIEQSACSGV